MIRYRCVRVRTYRTSVTNRRPGDSSR